MAVVTGASRGLGFAIANYFAKEGATVASYGTSKAGIIGLTRTVANDWGKYGITVNCIVPVAKTEIWDSVLPEGYDNPFTAFGMRSNALEYAGDPERHIAPVVGFLASEDADYITGAVIPVDGGLIDLE